MQKLTSNETSSLHHIPSRLGSSDMWARNFYYKRLSETMSALPEFIDWCVQCMGRRKRCKNEQLAKEHQMQEQGRFDPDVNIHQEPKTNNYRPQLFDEDPHLSIENIGEATPPSFQQWCRSFLSEEFFFTTWASSASFKWNSTAEVQKIIECNVDHLQTFEVSVCYIFCIFWFFYFRWSLVININSKSLFSEDLN